MNIILQFLLLSYELIDILYWMMVMCFIINNYGIKIFSSNVRGYNFRGHKFDYHKFSSKSLCNSFFSLNLKRQFARKSIEFHNLVLILIKAVCIYMSQKAFIVICIKMAQKKCQLNRVITVGEDSSSCALWKSQAGYFEHCIQDITHPSKADLPPPPPCRFTSQAGIWNFVPPGTWTFIQV